MPRAPRSVFVLELYGEAERGAGGAEELQQRAKLAAQKAGKKERRSAPSAASGQGKPTSPARKGKAASPGRKGTGKKAEEEAPVEDEYLDWWQFEDPVDALPSSTPRGVVARD